MLNIINEVPKTLFNLKASDLPSIFEKTTLIHLKNNKSDRTLFISSLLHGNEVSSLEVVKNILHDYDEGKVDCSLIVLIGNPQAAKEGERHLSDQLDYNRIWDDGHTPEQLMATQIFEYARKEKIWANIDLHNNTGKNPIYGCINRYDKQHLNFATYFSSNIVFFKEPSSTQSVKFGELCPSLTMECGQSMEKEGIDQASSFVREITKKEFTYSKPKFLPEFVFETFATLYVPQNIELSFNQTDELADLILIEGFDLLNFKEMTPGDCIGKSLRDHPIHIKAPNGDSLWEDYFEIRQQKIYAKKSCFPSMFSKNIAIIHSDCLGYIMKTIPAAKFK